MRPNFYKQQAFVCVGTFFFAATLVTGPVLRNPVENDDKRVRGQVFVSQQSLSREHLRSFCVHDVLHRQL